MPYFTRDEGMPLIAQTEALLAQYGPEAASVLAWDDARGVFTETDEEGTYDVPTREVDGVTLHGIGAACWTWELATP